MAKAEPKKERGRPTSYTEALAKEVCDRLSTGEPLAWICRDDHMPAVRTISDWKKAHETFSADFLRARDEGFDALATECLNIADDASNDYMERQKADGTKEEAYNGDHVQRSKLRIETRLKLLAKWDPRRYGDKLALDHSGDMGLNITISSDDAAL